MTADKKGASVDEKLDQVAEAAQEGLENTRELIGQAESSMEKARQALGERARSRTSEAYEKARVYLAEARAFLERAREKMGVLYGRSREIAEEAYEKAKVQFDRIASEVKRGYAAIKAKVDEIDVREVRDNVVDYIRKNPGKSIMIAAGVGFAIGYMIRPRES